jgi:hypothetical protein
MNNANKNVDLPKEVAEKFALKGWVGGHRQIFGRFGVVDLKELTVARAEALVKAGFSKLVKKGQSSPENNLKEKK